MGDLTRGPQAGKRAMGIIAAMVTLAAWVVIGLTLVPLPPRLDSAPHRAVGEMLAREALQLQQPGSRIVLITRDLENFKTPAYAAQTRAFESALKKAGLKTAITRVLKVDPLRAVAVPPGEFLELFGKLEDRDIIVSLLGPPRFDAGQLQQIGPRRPRVLAVCSGASPRQIELKGLFENKLLHGAVISRDDAAETPEDRFQLVTAANLSELPAPAAP